MFHHSPSMVGHVSRPAVGSPFLNDKDGGFTLIHEDHVSQAHVEVLNSRGTAKNLCADVERVMGEGDGVARNLFRSFVRRGAATIAKLDLTHCQVSQRCWFRNFQQHSQFVLLQSGRFVTVGCARTQILAAHAMSSPQGHTSL